MHFCQQDYVFLQVQVGLWIQHINLYVTAFQLSAIVAHNCWSSPREEVKYKDPEVYKLKIENVILFYKKDMALLKDSTG